MASESRGQTVESVTRVPLLDVSRGNAPLLERIQESIRELCQAGSFVGGKACQEFEAAMADCCDTRFAVGCASGSDALLVSLMALGIEPGDEVLIPSFTFFATASCVTRLGARPVWVDIDPDSFNLDPNDLKAKITARAKAIIPVHLFGQCAEMNEIMAIANQNDLAVVEDAAQAIGATFEGRPAGSIGDVGCFSFYPTKNLGAFGDGGVVTTNDEQLADRLRLFANHGMRPRYHHKVVGINSRLDAIQAKVLTLKMEKLPDWALGRQRNAARYQQLFASHGIDQLIAAPQLTIEGAHVWNQFTVRIPGGSRDQVRSFLADANIGTEIYYPIPVHRQECYCPVDGSIESLPVTDRAAEEVLSLPIFPELTEAEQHYVVDRLAAAISAIGLGQRKAS